MATWEAKCTWIAKYPLRGADSVHMASALWLGNSTRGAITFVASDANLLDAAAKENLDILDLEG